MALSPREKLAAAITRVCGVGSSDPSPGQRGVAPYFGAIVRGLVRKECPEIPTLAVTYNGILLWSPEFFARESIEVLTFAIVHEAMHVALKHFDRAKMMGFEMKPDAEDGDAALANWAQDACINTQCRKAGHKVPDWALVPERPSPLWFGAPAQPEGLVWEQRYRLLKEHRTQRQQGKGTQPNGAGGKGKAGSASSKQQAGGGWCGSCAGHPVAGEAPISAPDKDGRSEAEMERMRKSTAEAVKKFGEKYRGEVPADLDRWADSVLAPPRVPWREKLARIVRGAVAFKSGACDYTYAKISRRQAGVGFGVGRPIVPAQHQPLPDVAVVIDTSGSMGEDDLAAAASELSGVLQAVGAAVTVIACDAEIHGVRECKSIKDAASLFKGGGGTSMTPAMEYLAKKPRPPSVVILLTDGHIGNGYMQREPDYKVVWCVIGKNGNTEPCPYGAVVCVDEAEEKEAA